MAAMPTMTLATALLVASMAMLVHSAFSNIPKLPDFGNDPIKPWFEKETLKCWSPLWNIKGCLIEISKSFKDGKSPIGHLCCNAITQISKTSCWRKMFPVKHFSKHHMLKNYCARAAGPTPAAAPKGVSQSAKTKN